MDGWDGMDERKHILTYTRKAYHKQLLKKYLGGLHGGGDDVVVLLLLRVRGKVGVEPLQDFLERHLFGV